MDRDIESLKEDLKSDMAIIDLVIEQVELAKSKVSELARYNEDLKNSFDAEVQKTAMRILEASSTGMNDGGGSLVYRAS